MSTEVNWNHRKGIEDFVKLSIDEKEVLIRKSHLWELLFFMAPDDVQEQLIDLNVVRTPIHSHSTVVNILAKKDIRKGEMINVPMTVSINGRTGQIMIKP